MIWLSNYIGFKNVPMLWGAVFLGVISGCNGGSGDAAEEGWDEYLESVKDEPWYQISASERKTAEGEPMAKCVEAQMSLAALMDAFDENGFSYTLDADNLESSEVSRFATLRVEIDGNTRVLEFGRGLEACEFSALAKGYRLDSRRGLD